MTTKLYDTPLIVGASVAGAMTALRLARAGVSTIVLESRKTPFAKVCGEGFHPAGRVLLEEVLGDVSDLGMPLTGFEFSTPKGPLLALDHPCGELGLGCDRLLLERRLWQALESAPRVDFRTGATVRNMTTLSHGWLVTTAGEGQFECGRVVGADGVRSQVRRWSGRERRREHGRWGLRQRFRVGDGETPSAVHICFCGTAEIFVTPLAEGRVSIAVLGEEATIRRLGDPDHLRTLLTPIDCLLEPEDEARVLPYRGREASRFCGDGVYLAGDAAAFLDPVSGAGMTLAAVFAAVLAEVLAHPRSRRRDAEAERKLRRCLRAYGRLTRCLRWIGASAAFRRSATALLRRLPRLLRALSRPTEAEWAKGLRRMSQGT